MTGPADARSIEADFRQIHAAVLNFAWRDQARWSDLRTLFGHDASIHLSWYRGSVDGFIERSAAMAASGAPSAKHLIWPPRIELSCDRAVAESDVSIAVRLPTPTGEVDMTSWARFQDLFARHDDRWVIEKRTAIYERDRLDVVTGEAPGGDGLAAYPAAYRHMAFMLRQVGRAVRDDIVTAGSEAEKDIVAEGRSWLENAMRVLA